MFVLRFYFLKDVKSNSFKNLNLNLSDDETTTSKHVNRYKPQNYSSADNDNDIPMGVYRQPQIVIADDDDKNDTFNNISSFNKINSSNVISTTNANVNKTSLIDKKKQKWIQDKRKFFLSIFGFKRFFRITLKDLEIKKSIIENFEISRISNCKYRNF